MIDPACPTPPSPADRLATMAKDLAEILPNAPEFAAAAASLRESAETLRAEGAAARARAEDLGRRWIDAVERCDFDVAVEACRKLKTLGFRMSRDQPRRLVELEIPGKPMVIDGPPETWRC